MLNIAKESAEAEFTRIMSNAGNVSEANDSSIEYENVQRIFD